MTPTERAIAAAGLKAETADDILDRLGDLSGRMQMLAHDLDELRTRRDNLIAEAVALGAPREEIVFQTGLSRQAIYVIARDHRA